MTATVSAPPTASATLPAEHIAYDEYLDHQKQCRQCRTSLFVCPTGAELWDAFKAVLPGSH